MRKYVFDNATVYISEPTKEQIENLKRSTEKFVQKLAKEGLLNNEQTRRSNRRIGKPNSNAR